MALYPLSKEAGWTPITNQRAQNNPISLHTQQKAQILSDFEVKRKANLIQRITYNELIYYGYKILSKHMGGIRGKKGIAVTYQLYPSNITLSSSQSKNGWQEIHNELKDVNMYEERISQERRNIYFRKVVLGKEKPIHAQQILIKRQSQ